jgi:hypothetical protein
MATIFIMGSDILGLSVVAGQAIFFLLQQADA